MSAEDEVRKASRKFYAALNAMANGNAGALSDVWGHGASVTAMHPVGGRHVGWNAVDGSFRQVGELASDGSIELVDQIVQVLGDVAYEVGVERGRFRLAGQPVGIDHRVTNIYQRQDGQWKLVHHHTDISPAMLQVLDRLQAPATQSSR